MAHAPALPAEAPADRGEMVHPTVQAPPVTPGKVAMWLFLATEVMFFTGLIGSYIVLRRQPADGLQQPVSPRDRPRPPGRQEGGGAGADGIRSGEGRRGHPRRHRRGARRWPRRWPIETADGHPGRPDPAQQAEALAERLKAAGAVGRGPGAGAAQVAPAVQPPDQPAEHRPDGRQHVHPDLLVGDDGPGPGGHPARRPARSSRRTCWPPS